MPSIDWEAPVAALSDEQIEGFGRELFGVYRSTVVSAKAEEELTTLETLVLSAGESIFVQDALNMAEAYSAGMQAAHFTDFTLFPFKFLKALTARFHEPLCAELRENKDIVLLAPTLVTLLNLPVELAAFAVPISAIIARIGIGGLCREYPEKSRDPSFAASQIQLHEANLRYLELERARQLPGPVPPELDRAIRHEEKRLKSLHDGE